MFHAIAKPMASLLAFFYNLIPNYGVAIILLTLSIMLILTPFTIKSTRSMLAMQRLQPELKRLQAQHKNDRQALNEAMMAFYKEHNVNPLGGCLPMLLQMPVFFGLYEAIRGLTHNPPKGLSTTSDLYKALCGTYDTVAKTCSNAVNGHISMKSFGMDLANAATRHPSRVAAAIPFWVLIARTTATQYYQQRQLNNRNPQAAAANPQLQMTQKLFPIIFLVIYINIPAAVVLYFLVSNLLRIAQQGAMWKWDPKLVAEVATDKREVESKTIDAKPKPVIKGKNDRTPAKGIQSGNQSKQGNQSKGTSSQSGNGAKPPPKPTPNKSGGSTGARSAPRQRGRARRGR